jgi:hypothetical protein
MKTRIQNVLITNSTCAAYSEGTSGWFADKTTFAAGLVQSFLVIVFIEIGDRTFFIAALMAGTLYKLNPVYP